MNLFDSVKKDPMYRFLVVLTIASTVGLQSWQTLFNNFAVEAGGLQGDQVGMVQGIREIPGFLTFLVVFVVAVIREHRLSALSVFVLGAGVAVTGLFPSYMGILATTLAMSFGFHYYETTNQSLTLQYFDKDRSPWVFGKQRSYAAATNIVVGLCIWLMASVFAYPVIYMIMGGGITVAAVWGLARNPTRKDTFPQRNNMVFRLRYWLFYLLTFMAGARRQIFMAFSVLLLVEKFQFTVQDITLLFVVNNVINYFLSPAIGRAIIRFGERRVLSLEYASLIVIFIQYAVVDSAWIVSILFILDHIFFNFSIAIHTFFQKTADPADIAPSMAVGFAINHIAAVVLPPLGGLLWMVDYRIPFIGGAGLAILSLGAVQLIRSGRTSG